MYERLEQIAVNGFDPDLTNFLSDSYWYRNNALGVGITSDKFESNVFIYLKRLEIARHRYFLTCAGNGRHVGFDEAIDSFYDNGFAIGFSERWKEKGPKALLDYRLILHARSLEAAHKVIGDYKPLLKQSQEINLSQRAA